MRMGHDVDAVDRQHHAHVGRDNPGVDGGVTVDAFCEGVQLGLEAGVLRDIPALPARRYVVLDLNQPTQRRALPNMRIQGLSAERSPGVQLICTLRATRSGWGISAVMRPSAVVTAVRPPGLPLGLAG